MRSPTVPSATEVPDTPRHWLHRASMAAVVVVLVILASSAYLRQTTVRLNCADWPACTQRITAEDSVRAQPATVRLARFVHRLSASTAGALVLLIAYLAWAQQPRVRKDVVLSAALVGVTVCLAVLGRWSRNAQAPPVTLGNLLGGMTLLVLLHWMRLRTSRAPTAPDGGDGLAPVAGAALALAIAVVFLGALVSSSHAASTLRDASGSLLASAHWLSGLLVLLLAAMLAVHPVVRGGGRRAGVAAFALALALALTGWISTRFDYPLAATLTHNLLAALLLIVLVTAAYLYIGSSHAHR